jgi:hypothetical protein
MSVILTLLITIENVFAIRLDVIKTGGGQKHPAFSAAFTPMLRKLKLELRNSSLDIKSGSVKNIKNMSWKYKKY